MFGEREEAALRLGKVGESRRQALSNREALLAVEPRATPLGIILE